MENVNSYQQLFNQIEKSEWLDFKGRTTLKYICINYPNKRETISQIVYALNKANRLLGLTPKAYLNIRLTISFGYGGIGYKYKVSVTHGDRVLLTSGRVEMEDVAKDIMLTLKQVRKYKLGDSQTDDLEQTLKENLTQCQWIDTKCVNDFVAFIIKIDGATIDILLEILNGCNKKLSKIGQQRIFLTRDKQYISIRVGNTKQDSEVVAKTDDLLLLDDYVLQAFGSLIYKSNLLTE